IALGVSSAIQRVAKRVHSMTSARGLSAALVTLAAGIALVWLSIDQQSVTIGVLANIVVGAGIGIGLVSALIEVQRIAGDKDLAGLTGVFYAAAYLGFLAPAVITAVTGPISLGTIFAIITAMAAACWLALLASSRAHIPGARTVEGSEH